MRGMGRILKRGQVYWIAYYHHGKEYRESSRSGSRKDAERLLKARLKEVGADQLGLRRFIGPAQDRLTVSELLETLEQHYRLRKGRAAPQFIAHLRPIREAFGDLRAVSVSEDAVDRYITERLAEGKAPATVNRETQLLGQAFRLAVERKRLSSAPKIRRLPERNTRQGFFEAPEFDALLEHLPEHLKDFGRFGYITGWRKGEIASLTWADVDHDGRVIRLRPEASKSGEGRLIALEWELWSIIERRWQARQLVTADAVRLIPWVFHRNGLPIGEFRRAWASACKAAGLTNRLFHDLRRTAIRNLLRAGALETVIMQISGHRTRAVFDRYNITSERDIRDALRRTQAYVKALPAERTVVPFQEVLKGRESENTDKTRTIEARGATATAVTP